MVMKSPDRGALAAAFKDDRTVKDFEALFMAFGSLLDAVNGGGVYTRAFAPGDVVWSAAATRAGALAMDGASYLRADYPDLFTAIGVVYGAADGTHFNVPNAAGRVIAGKEAAETLITTAVSGFSGATLGAKGGLQNHKLLTAEMPAHAHAQDSRTYISATPYGAPIGTDFSLNTGGTTQSTGGDGFHRNVQPTIILNAFIIY